MDRTTDRITIGDYLLKRLAEAGIEHVLGVPGDYNLQFIEQIVAHEHVEFVGTCNELNAAYAADGYARLNGSSALLTTYGVGELSAICGVAGAAAEHVPMVCITGAPPLHMMEQCMPLHHSLGDGNYENMMASYSQFTCAQTRITPQNAAQEIDRVLSACLSEKRPVYIQLPSNISFLTIEAPATPLRQSVQSTPESLEAALQDLKDTILNARAPALLIDLDVSRLGVQELLGQLAARAGIPYAALNTGKAILSEQDPLFLGFYSGAGSADAAKTAIENSDCLITVSPRFLEINSGLFSHKVRRENMITLSAASAEICGRHHEGVSAPDLLVGLLETLPNKREDAPQAPGQTGWTVDPDAALTQERLWPRVARFFTGNDVILGESGTSHHGLMSQKLPAGAQYISQSIWGAIGYTLPATLGVSLARPDKRHILFIGDGSFQLTAQELSTLLRMKLKPIIFLINNRGYTIERHILGMDRSYNDIANWDYCALPSAFGGDQAFTTVKASTEAELETALTIAARNDRLCFIELALDPVDAPASLAKFGPLMADFDYGPFGPRN